MVSPRDSRHFESTHNATGVTVMISGWQLSDVKSVLYFEVFLPREIPGESRESKPTAFDKQCSGAQCL